jgi:hypothetical protein
LGFKFPLLLGKFDTGEVLGNFFYSVLIAYKNNILRDVFGFKIQVVHTAVGV